MTTIFFRTICFPLANYRCPTRKKEPPPVFLSVIRSFSRSLFSFSISPNRNELSLLASVCRQGAVLICNFLPNRQTDASAITVGSRREKQINFFFLFLCPSSLLLSVCRKWAATVLSLSTHAVPGMMLRFVGVGVSRQSISVGMMRKSSCIYIS